MHLNIKEIIDKKGLNRNQFAMAMQITYKAACKLYEGTTTSINFDTLESICRVLDCTPNDILIPDTDFEKRILAYETALHKHNGDNK